MKIITGDTIYEPSTIKMVDEHLIVYKAITGSNKLCTHFRAIYCSDEVATKTMFDTLRKTSALDLDVVCDEWDNEESPLFITDGVITIYEHILSPGTIIPDETICMMFPLTFKENTPENRELMESRIRDNANALLSLCKQFIF